MIYVEESTMYSDEDGLMEFIQLRTEGGRFIDSITFDEAAELINSLQLIVYKSKPKEVTK